MDRMDIIAKWINENSEELIRIADSIHREPELAYEEYKSCSRLAGYLEGQGFRVMMGTAGLETAFTAEWGSGEPFIGFLAEYDALPGLGRSALDAAELMNVGVNYLREHVPTDVRMFYAYENNGIPANVVPDRAVTDYFIRSPKRSMTEEASERIDSCARGAAMMTGTSVEIRLEAYCDEMKVNRPLCELYYKAMKNIPVPEYSEEEYSYAEKISEEAGLHNEGRYFAGLCELEDEPQIIYIGTDASQVSHTVPLITLSAQTMVRGTAIHHWANEKQAGMSIGWKGMLYAARCMAEGTVLLMETPGAIEEALEYHRKR